MKNKTGYIFLGLTLFGIAFGYIESAVVVYLREILYPAGFIFPLKLIPQNLLITEICRELATIVILVSLSTIICRNFTEFISYFLFSFAVWDIFYYVWLKILLNWPDSLLTWDVLFLIPVVWTGPILAPILISINMIITALLLHTKQQTVKPNIFTIINIILIITLFFITFIWDVPQIASQQIPTYYPWTLFLTAELLWGNLIFNFCKSQSN